MDVIYKCLLVGPSVLLALADFAHMLRSRECYITFLPRSLWIDHSLLFELSRQLLLRVQPGPMTCVSCLIGLWYDEPLPSLSLHLFLFFLLLYPCDARYPSQLLKVVSLIGRH